MKKKWTICISFKGSKTNRDELSNKITHSKDSFSKKIHYTNTAILEEESSRLYMVLKKTKKDGYDSCRNKIVITYYNMEFLLK